jgi:hypothetical protein
MFLIKHISTNLSQKSSTTLYTITLLVLSILIIFYKWRLDVAASYNFFKCQIVNQRIKDYDPIFFISYISIDRREVSLFWFINTNYWRGNAGTSTVHPAVFRRSIHACIVFLCFLLHREINLNEVYNLNNEFGFPLCKESFEIFFTAKIFTLPVLLPSHH